LKQRLDRISHFENLSFIGANLSDDKNWDAAVKGCDYVLHVVLRRGSSSYKSRYLHSK